jgi:hypothetical protein
MCQTYSVAKKGSVRKLGKQGRRRSAESCPVEGAVLCLRALVPLGSVDNIT